MPTPAAQLSPRRRVIRAWGVLLLLLGLSAVTLAAASSGRPDPASAVLTAARAHLGDTYTWGATGPKTWDCSGFTSVLWHDVGGVDVPRTSRQQQAWAVPLPIEQALPGDLVFFGDPVTHVGLVQSRVTRGTGAGATHTLTMVDASSSQKGVVERRVWSSGTVRFGRVPRKGMPPVTPWTAPTPAASPMPSTSPSTPSPAPSPAPSASPSSAPSPAPSPAPALAALAAQGATRVSPALPGLPAVQSVPSSAVAQKAVRLASAALGNQTLTDAGLVANVWRRAGGAALPTARAALVAKAHRVPLADARLGDLVVYAAPASHVGLYLGEGTMIDASRALHAVVSRPVWSAPGVQIMRLPG